MFIIAKEEEKELSNVIEKELDDRLKEHEKKEKYLADNISDVIKII